MMDDDLVCNFKKCRKRITNVAWVTSCSHIFCEEDGTREFAKQQVCPACSTVLSNQLDLIQVDIHPSEQYKSMVLAGQRPEVIMEICSRAMSFWTYQAHQERIYQEYVATKATEKAQKQETHFEQLLAFNQSELSTHKSQISSLRKDLEAVRTKFNEVSEKLQEKTRQYQKLQGMYEALRRRNINPSSLDSETDKRTSRAGQPPTLKPHPSFELGSLADRSASSLHKRQQTDFFLSSGQISGGLPLSGNIHQATGIGMMAVSSNTTTNASIPAGFQIDPSLAAAVNSAAALQSAQQGKASEQFAIKMGKEASHHGKQHGTK